MNKDTIGYLFESIFKKNIKEIDQVSANVSKLFLPWKNYLRISI